MIQYVVFKHSFDYCGYMCSDFQNLENVVFVEPYSFGRRVLWKKLCNLHRRITGRTDNFSRVWYPAMFDFQRYPAEQKIAFCFFDSAYELYNRGFLHWLKSKYKNSKIYAFVLNPLCGDLKKSEYLNSECDKVFSYDIYDCSRYGFTHFYGLMPTLEGYFDFPKVEVQYDICFIGRDKGRYQEIKHLYKTLSESGIRCLFYILTDTSIGDEWDFAICQTQPLKFSQVLQMEASAEILLDYTFVKGGEQGLTLRVMDAVGLNKGIISNNKYLKTIPIWNEEKIRLIDQLEDITPQMIQDLVQKKGVSYMHKEIFSGLTLLSDIESDILASD